MIVLLWAGYTAFLVLVYVPFEDLTSPSKWWAGFILGPPAAILFEAVLEEGVDGGSALMHGGRNTPLSRIMRGVVLGVVILVVGALVYL